MQRACVAWKWVRAAPAGWWYNCIIIFVAWRTPLIALLCGARASQPWASSAHVMILCYMPWGGWVGCLAPDCYSHVDPLITVGLICKPRRASWIHPLRQQPAQKGGGVRRRWCAHGYKGAAVFRCSLTTGCWAPPAWNLLWFVTTN